MVSSPPAPFTACASITITTSRKKRSSSTISVRSARMWSGLPVRARCIFARISMRNCAGRKAPLPVALTLARAAASTRRYRHSSPRWNTLPKCRPGRMWCCRTRAPLRLPSIQASFPANGPFGGNHRTERAHWKVVGRMLVRKLHPYRHPSQTKLLHPTTSRNRRHTAICPLR